MSKWTGEVQLTGGVGWSGVGVCVCLIFPYLGALHFTQLRRYKRQLPFCLADFITSDAFHPHD